MNRNTIIFCFLIALSSLPIAGCKDNIKSSIPDYPVYLQLNLTAQYSTFKNSSGQFLSFEKGVTANERVGFGGVIVCTGLSLDDYGETQYYAFDMTCPYEIKNTVKVHPDTQGLPHLVCDKCGSVFDISFGYGNPLSGPAKEFLKKYRTSFSGDVLYVNK